MNKAEELVNKLCTKSFLSLWSYPNPRGKDSGKELCDILVVCEPDVIIFSVKEIGLTNSSDISVDWKRWLKRAVKESTEQIYGAERWIFSNRKVITKEGQEGLTIPKASTRRIHRVAVAMGSGRKVPTPSGDFKKGFVHVFDELSLDIIMNELDTISDFTKYLRDKEALFREEVKIALVGGEEDLLAPYLKEGRRFPEEWTAVTVNEGLWREFSQRPEYKRKKEENKHSYLWDQMLELICEYFYAGELQVGNTLSDVDDVLRIMARENRFSRRYLSKSLEQFIRSGKYKKIRSRFVQSPSGVPYVFLQRPHGYDRNQRRAELANRCYVVKGMFTNQSTVVGIATEEFDPKKGTSFDIVKFSKDNWTPEDEERAQLLREEKGYFKKEILTYSHENEYPEA